MTFDELFQSYVNYGFTKPTTPVEGIMQVAQPEMIAPINMNVPIAPAGDREQIADPNTPTTARGPMSVEGIMQAIGFALNPAMGLANIATQQMTGKSIAQNVIDAISAMRSGDSGGVNTGFTGTPSQMAALASEYSGGFGGGMDASSMASEMGGFGDTGTATGGDGGGVGSSSDAGAADTSTEGSFAKGGIVSLYG